MYPAAGKLAARDLHQAHRLVLRRVLATMMPGSTAQGV